MKNHKKGITLAEVVVAMSLVVIMMVAIFTVCEVSVSTKTKATERYFFANECQNITTAYFLGEDKFEKAIKLLTNYDVNYGTSTTILYDSNFELVTKNEKYSINIYFEDATHLKIECKNKDKMIYELEV